MRENQDSRIGLKGWEFVEISNLIRDKMVNVGKGGFFRTLEGWRTREPVLLREWFVGQEPLSELGRLHSAQSDRPSQPADFLSFLYGGVWKR